MKKYILADIHGNLKGLKQVFELVNFDYENDILIQLGDIVDGYPEVFECIEELLKIKNLISIKGNHDDMFLTFINGDYHPMNWSHGGNGTLYGYCLRADKEYFKYIKSNGSTNFSTTLVPEDIPIEHINFFRNQLLYHIDENNNMFVHGGFNRHQPIEWLKENLPNEFFWDRNLWFSALTFKDMELTANGDKPKFKMKENFNKVFIGHTTTINWKYKNNYDGFGNLINKKGQPIITPMKAANIINLDTGSGFNGPLTLWCLDDNTFVQSERSDLLYPNWQGRGK